MPSPFPGMNPYLENPEFWSEVHHLLISILAETLNPQLLPKYRVAIEKRVYQMNGEDALLVGIPDVTVEHSRTSINPNQSKVAVATPPSTPVTVTVPVPLEFREGYLEVREVTTKEVITVIEVLSPSNKRPGKGRETYLEKRQQVLASRTHLVEIDLLRGGKPMPVSGDNTQWSYRILVSQCDRRPHANLYVFNLQDLIPTFPLPLRTEDTEPIIDLYLLLDRVYDRAGYAFAIDSNGEPLPPADPTTAEWIDALLQENQLRSMH